MIFNDKIKLDLSHKKNHNGFLEVDGYLARIGIQKYLIDGEIKEVHRKPNEVFSQKSLQSFENAVITDNHPHEAVTPLNFKKYAKGWVRDVRREGKYIKGRLIIVDKDLQDKIENGKVELSAGYEADTVVNDSGELEQKNIVANHVAVVDKGRCSDDGVSKCALKTDSILDDSDKLMIKDTIIADLTAENNNLKKELESLKVKMLKDELKMVNDSIETLRDVKIEFIKSKVANFVGDDANDSYIDGMFEALKVVKVESNPLKQLDSIDDMCSTKKKKTADEAREEMIKKLKGGK